MTSTGFSSHSLLLNDGSLSLSLSPSVSKYYYIAARLLRKQYCATSNDSSVWRKERKKVKMTRIPTFFRKMGALLLLFVSYFGSQSTFYDSSLLSSWGLRRWIKCRKFSPQLTIRSRVADA